MCCSVEIRRNDAQLKCRAILVCCCGTNKSREGEVKKQARKRGERTGSSRLPYPTIPAGAPLVLLGCAWWLLPASSAGDKRLCMRGWRALSTVHRTFSITPQPKRASCDITSDKHVPQAASSAEAPNMINAFLVFNGQGQPRLTKFYTQLVSPRFSGRVLLLSPIVLTAAFFSGHINTATLDFRDLHPRLQPSFWLL